MPHIHPALILSLALSGCGAIGAVSDATTEMDAYTLSPVAAAATPATGTRHLVVELPTTSGALMSDRILIKPIPYQAQYLPDARWSEPTPALLQTLLVASFQNTGGFRLVGRTGAGLMPDVTLMSELLSFQAEPVSAPDAAMTLRVSVNMTLIGETDRRIIATRRFSVETTVASNDTPAIIAGFDSATRSLLQDAVKWTLANAG
jgi:cholesterol transport system auxiliary component